MSFTVGSDSCCCQADELGRFGCLGSAVILSRREVKNLGESDPVWYRGDVTIPPPSPLRSVSLSPNYAIPQIVGHTFSFYIFHILPRLLRETTEILSKACLERNQRREDAQLPVTNPQNEEYPRKRTRRRDKKLHTGEID